MTAGSSFFSPFLCLCWRSLVSTPMWPKRAKVILSKTRSLYLHRRMTKMFNPHCDARVMGVCRRARRRWVACRSRRRSCALRSVTSASPSTWPRIHSPTSRNSSDSWRPRPARGRRRSPGSRPACNSSSRCPGQLRADTFGMRPPRLCLSRLIALLSARST